MPGYSSVKVEGMIVDFCAYLGDWPTYELPYRTADGLLSLMDRCGVGAACVSLAGGMFAFDAREANERLVQAIAPHRNRLWPIGTLDPTVPTWREDLEDGLERLDLAGFRLHPTYQGYPLDSPDVLDLAGRLTDAGRPLFVALYVDEERFQHPAIRVPDVPIAEIVRLIRQAPATTIVLNSLKVEHALPLLEAELSLQKAPAAVPGCGNRPEGGPQSRLFSGEAELHLDRVYLDINAMDMPFDGLRSLAETHGVDRLVFGSQMPFLYPEAALMVVEHSGLASVEIEAILERNWQASPVLAGLAI